MIGVFNVYLGCGWQADGAVDQLWGLLDTVPGFLYCPVTVPADLQALSSLDGSERRRIVKLAMTQAHVAVLPAQTGAGSEAWTGHEVSVAVTGFRRAIPVLAVAPSSPTADVDERVVLRADQFVGWHAGEIACAIQQLAEAAAANRRLGALEQARSADGEGRSDGDDPGLRVGRTARALPTAEIMHAYKSLLSPR